MSACRAPAGGDGLLRFDLDKEQPERLIRYYLGALLPPSVSVDSVLVGSGPTWALREEAVVRALGDPPDTNADGRITWEEWEVFVERRYYSAVGWPARLDGLDTADSSQSGMLVLDVRGVMTNAQRRVRVRRAAVDSALAGWREAGKRLLYPTGTLMLGDHLVDGRRVETTVMRKRAEGFWDFAVYDELGRLAPETTTEPKRLRAPVQCVGCHFGTRLFEPEKSFPAAARPGPAGPRSLDAPASANYSQLVPLLDEHRKRSDTVLGLYATVRLAEISGRVERGEASEAERRLLEMVRP